MTRLEQVDAPTLTDEPWAGRRALLLPISIASAALYILTAAPTAFWLDSSELSAAAFELGVSHPPGHPLFVLLTKLGTLLLPFGTIAFRVHVLCALLMGASVQLTGLLALRLHSCRAIWWIVLSLPLAALSLPFWFHGVRAEVYPLQLICGFAILAATFWVRSQASAASFLGLGFITGLSMCNHHYLAALMAPGVFWLLISDRRCRGVFARRLPWSFTGLMWGLLAYLQIPIRAAANPVVNWGSGDSIEGLAWIVSARAFQKTAGRSNQLTFEGVFGNLVNFFDSNIGLIALSLAAIGLAAMAARRWRLAVGFSLLIAGNLLSQVLFDFDPNNPDVGGYLLLTTVLLVVLATGGVVFLSRVAGALTVLSARLVRSTLVVVLLLGSLVAWSDHGLRADLSDFRDTDVIADAGYQPLPTDALLLTSYFETIFHHWYRQVAECRRPDVLVVHRLFRTYPGYDRHVQERYPQLSGMFDAPAALGQLNVNWLTHETSRRPVLLEMDATLQTALLPRLRPLGFWLWLVPEAVPTTAYPPFMLSEIETFWGAVNDDVDLSVRETRGNLLWSHFNQATFFLTVGQREAALLLIELAEELAPGDPDLALLRQAAQP